jgi:hypothetical protein
MTRKRRTKLPEEIVIEGLKAMERMRNALSVIAGQRSDLRDEIFVALDDINELGSIINGVLDR